MGRKQSMGGCHSQQYIKPPFPFFLIIYCNKKPVPIFPRLDLNNDWKKTSIICCFWVGISKECFIQWFQSAAVETKWLIMGWIKQLGDTCTYLLVQRQRKTTWGAIAMAALPLLGSDIIIYTSFFIYSRLYRLMKCTPNDMPLKQIREKSLES